MWVSMYFTECIADVLNHLLLITENLLEKIVIIIDNIRIERKDEKNAK
jgi:hypothetical protein